jgi:CubicO group peptidase (beta-lactamase class C family)
MVSNLQFIPLNLSKMNDLVRAHSFEVVGGGSACAIRRASGYSGQNAVAVLFHAIAQRAFPGAAFAVFRDAETVLQGAVGRFTYDETAPDITLSTIYDLASVTKVVATTSMAMLLCDRGQLDLNRPVVEVLPEFAGGDPQRKKVTVEMLLAHSSGLPAYAKLFLQAKDRDSLLQLACTVPLEADPGTRAEYSDIGFIVLGELLQRLAGETLESFCSREVFSPLKMKSTSYCPGSELRNAIPPTVDDREFRHRVIQGEVHDENASLIGGVLGHAGVFSNTADLMKFSGAMLGAEPGLFRHEIIDLFTQRRQSPIGTSRALGWDTPSPPSQSGKYYSRHSYGHLGYTGTSLWIDGEHHIAIALLTNRTWPDKQSQLIKQVRPAFHDAVMEELLRTS